MYEDKCVLYRPEWKDVPHGVANTLNISLPKGHMKANKQLEILNEGAHYDKQMDGNVV